jgi:hypothetical protein
MSEEKTKYWYEIKGMKYYEVEGAVFRQDDGPLEVYQDGNPGKWAPYTGDTHRIHMQSNILTLEEVTPYMDVPNPYMKK